MKTWRWRKENEDSTAACTLMDGQGRNRVTVWDNGVWHSWDEDGVGGENGSCENVQDAMDQAVAAVVHQGWTPFRIDCSHACSILRPVS